eukprot:403370043
MLGFRNSNLEFDNIIGFNSSQISRNKKVRKTERKLGVIIFNLTQTNTNQLKASIEKHKQNSYDNSVNISRLKTADTSQTVDPFLQKLREKFKEQICQGYMPKKLKNTRNLEFVKNFQLQNGYGIQLWPDGSKYEGFWLKNQAYGFGRFILCDGESFEGNWKEDKAYGYGKYFYTDGSIYEGEWYNDKQEGMGYESWPDGSRFEGQYKEGKKNGNGKFTWKDGAQYEGSWYQNKMHGEGTFK